jgi:hypothetical protein
MSQGQKITKEVDNWENNKYKNFLTIFDVSIER